MLGQLRVTEKQRYSMLGQGDGRTRSRQAVRSSLSPSVGCRRILETGEHPDALILVKRRSMSEPYCRPTREPSFLFHSRQKQRAPSPCIHATHQGYWDKQQVGRPVHIFGAIETSHFAFLPRRRHLSSINAKPKTPWPGCCAGLARSTPGCQSP